MPWLSTPGGGVGGINNEAQWKVKGLQPITNDHDSY